MIGQRPEGLSCGSTALLTPPPSLGASSFGDCLLATNCLAGTPALPQDNTKVTFGPRKLQNCTDLSAHASTEPSFS